MAFSKNYQNITIDGDAVVSLKPRHGSLTDIGFVSNVSGEMIPIVRETTLGDISVGYDLKMNATMCQTKDADHAAAIDAVDCEQFKIQGNSTILILNDVFLKIAAKVTFDNKSTSEVTIECIKKGQTAAQAKAWLSDAS
jgi:hypothetical protein